MIPKSVPFADMKKSKAQRTASAFVSGCKPPRFHITVCLADDFIVRGAAGEKIVRSPKSADAKEVHMRIPSPLFRYTCCYGTDIGSEESLIANKMNIDEICRNIGTDSSGTPGSMG